MAGKREKKGGGDAAKEVLKKWERLAQEKQLADQCHVEITTQDHWFVLDGWVDKHATKGLLFSLVPEHDQARWIVDRIRVGQVATSAKTAERTKKKTGKTRKRRPARKVA